jgi:hypothetical protein
MPTDTPSPAAQRFRDMADTIEANTNFGGCFVIVPPEGAGEPVQTLLLDPSPDPAQFWSMIQTKCQIQLAEIEMAKRNNAAFGRR